MKKTLSSGSDNEIGGVALSPATQVHEQITKKPNLLDQASTSGLTARERLKLVNTASAGHISARLHSTPSLLRGASIRSDFGELSIAITHHGSGPKHKAVARIRNDPV